MNILANLGSLFSGDGLIIFLVILLLFGAKRLPELARGLGLAVREFSKAKDEIEHEISRSPSPSPRIEPPVDTQPRVIQSESTPVVSASSTEEPHRQTADVPHETQSAPPAA